MPVTCSRSWGVAVICSVLNFLHLGTARLSGSMYLAVLERYHVDRSQASLPFILCYTVRNISGPLVGYLATKFGIYTVTILGGLIAFIGIGGCYFAEDIIVVILFWGIIFGFGFGMGSVLIPEILNQHFDKYVSNANGVAFGGECVAGFVLPILLKFSFSTYGTSGTFLILSSIMLNSIPAALLLKYFSPSQPSNNSQLSQNEENLMGSNRLHCSLNLNEEDLGPSEVEDDESDEKTKLLKTCQPSLKSLKANYGSDLKKRFITTNWQKDLKNQHFYEPLEVEQASKNQHTNAEEQNDSISRSYPEPKRKCKHAQILESNIASNSKIENQNSSIKYYDSLDKDTKHEEKNYPQNVEIGSHENISDGFSYHNATIALPNAPTSSLQPHSTAIGEDTLRSSPFKIFLDPAFCMILLTQSTMLFNATLLWTIIVDFSRDADLSSKEEIYILVFLSVFDMIGRLGLGWITDGGYVANSTFSGLCCFVMGISVGTLVLFKKVATIGCSVSVFGLCFGGFLIVCPGMVNDHIDQTKRGMALASRFFLFAPLSLSQSSLIGYFRGKLGSYNIVFIIVAILCLFSSVTSLLTPYAEKYRERRKNKSNSNLEKNLHSIVSTATSVRELANDSLSKAQQPLELAGKLSRSFLEA